MDRRPDAAISWLLQVPPPSNSLSLVQVPEVKRQRLLPRPRNILYAKQKHNMQTRGWSHILLSRWTRRAPSAGTGNYVAIWIP
jgi:hypothetical protein